MIAKVLQGSPATTNASPENTKSPESIGTPSPLDKELTLLLVDTSASMLRFDTKGAVTEYVGRLGSRELAGLIIFGEKAVSVLPFGPPDRFPRVLEKLNYYPPGRFTDIRAGLETAIIALGQVPAPAKRLVLFTDGLNEPRAVSSTSERTIRFDGLDSISLEVVIIGDKVSPEEIKKMLPQAKKVSRYPGT